jgi:hypothetical protein
MSALAKLYASRGANAAATGGQERIMPKVPMPGSLGVVTAARRSPEDVARSIDVETPMSKLILDERSKGKLREYTSALGVLENVNLAFSDLLAKVDESESIRDELAAECDKQDQVIQQLHYDLDAAKRRSDEMEKQNAEMADKLVAESHRAANWELKTSQAEKALMEAQRRIDDLEEVCKTLHDGIYAIFGANSPVQKAMTSLGKDAVAQG